MEKQHTKNLYKNLFYLPFIFLLPIPIPQSGTQPTLKPPAVWFLKLGSWGWLGVMRGGNLLTHPLWKLKEAFLPELQLLPRVAPQVRGSTHHGMGTTKK